MTGPQGLASHIDVGVCLARATRMRISPFRGPVLEHLIFPLSVRVAESSRLPREGGSKRDEQTGEQGEQRRACAGRERDWAPRGASREAYGACKQGAHRVNRHVPYSTDSRFEASRGFGAPL